MKIWEMMYDQAYESTIYKSDEYYEFFFKNFRGGFIEKYVEGIEIETSFKGEKAEAGEKCDILNMGVEPILLPKAKEILYEQIKDNVQFIKLRHDEYGACYMLNVIKVLDCLDESKIRYRGSGSIKKYVFKENINYPCIFKSTTGIRISIFVTDDFKKCIEENKLTGLALHLVWDSEKDN